MEVVLVAHGTLVVGAGHAGVQIAISLRERGYSDSITLVGGERHQPYQRPPLSKAFLAGDVSQEDLEFRHASYYREQNIELVRGELIEHVSLNAQGSKGGGLARARSGRPFAFDKIALAVGGRPRRLTVPGCDLLGVGYLSDIDDAVRLRSLLAKARDVVVLGGGFIGLEAAAAVRALGIRVTVVEAADRLIARAVDPIVSQFYLAAHRRRGVEFLLDTTATEVVGMDGRVVSIRTSDGRELPADLVLVGIGMLPRLRLAQAMGLRVDAGIVVDEYARTSVPEVVAAGDCTVLPHPTTGRGKVRLESVQNAVAQARIAAATLVGQEAPVRPVPWFWSDQGDLKLQIAGLSSGADRVIVRGDPSTESFSVLYYSGNTLLSADAVNAPRDYLVVRKALERGLSLDPEGVADPRNGLPDLLAIAQRANASTPPPAGAPSEH